jgi:hypothetical protein
MNRRRLGEASHFLNPIQQMGIGAQRQGGIPRRLAGAGGGYFQGGSGFGLHDWNFDLPAARQERPPAERRH